MVSKNIWMRIYFFVLKKQLNYLGILGQVFNFMLYNECLLFVPLHFSKCYNQGSQLVVQEVNSKFWVTWPRIAQFVYFLREMCLFFNFWMIKFTIMCFFDIHTWNFSSKVLYMSKNHNSFKKYTNWAKLSHFWGKCVFWHVEDLSWEISCMKT